MIAFAISSSSTSALQITPPQIEELKLEKFRTGNEDPTKSTEEERLKSLVASVAHRYEQIITCTASTQ